MGEMWIGIWGISLIGLFVIGVTVYDYFDRKKRNQEIKLWKYLLTMIVGLFLMFPILSGVVLWLLGLPL